MPTSERPAEAHWSERAERGSFWGLWFVLQLYRILGRRGLYLLLYPIIAYFYLTNPTARRHSRQFLERVYEHGGLAQPPRARDLFRHFFNFGESMVDRLAGWAGDWPDQAIRIIDNEPLMSQMDSGRGALVISSHLGNIEMSRLLPDDYGWRIHPLVYQAHAPGINRLLKQANPDADLNLIDISNFGPHTGVELEAVLDRGQCIAIAGDRTPPGLSRHVAWADFLGKPAPFPTGPFVLAALLRCPVYLLHCVKDAQGYRVEVERLTTQVTLARRSRQEDLQYWVGQYARALEARVLQDPLQWFNFYDFWNQS